MKHLHEKNEQLDQPTIEILDVFTNPGVSVVTLNQLEFTSLCPLTGQPDYATIQISYKPNSCCLESKSVKLYLSAFRNYKGFAETITAKIRRDCEETLQCKVSITTLFARRGGINIESNSTSERDFL